MPDLTNSDLRKIDESLSSLTAFYVYGGAVPSWITKLQNEIKSTRTKNINEKPSYRIELKQALESAKKQTQLDLANLILDNFDVKKAPLIEEKKSLVSSLLPEFLTKKRKRTEKQNQYKEPTKHEALSTTLKHIENALESFAYHEEQLKSQQEQHRDDFNKILDKFAEIKGHLQELQVAVDAKNNIGSIDKSRIKSLPLESRTIQTNGSPTQEKGVIENLKDLAKQPGKQPEKEIELYHLFERLFDLFEKAEKWEILENLKTGKLLSRKEIDVIFLNLQNHISEENAASWDKLYNDFKSLQEIANKIPSDVLKNPPINVPKKTPIEKPTNFPLTEKKSQPQSTQNMEKKLTAPYKSKPSVSPSHSRTSPSGSPAKSKSQQQKSPSKNRPRVTIKRNSKEITPQKTTHMSPKN